MNDRPPFPNVLLKGVPNTVNGQVIADRIASSISLGMLSVGERLPTEMELASQFGVAVATLRKALATLRKQGIVETRRGRSGGTFIVRAPYPKSLELRNILSNISIVELRDLGDEQTAVATAIARLACSRVYVNALDRLTDLAHRLSEAPTPVEKATADSRFHIELAVLAQSPRLLRTEVRLQSESSPLLWADLGGVLSTETAISDHIALLDAIRDDDPERAQRISEEHIRKNVYHLIDTKLTLGLLAEDGQEVPS
jgi:DNA-binding FadR family transcriptional regulator